MRTLLSLVLGTMWIAGCATTRAYEDRLEGMVGKTSSQLEARWGRPLQVVPLDQGRSIYEYRRYDELAPPKLQERQLSSSAERGGPPAIGCRTQFVLSSQGIVERWRWVGDSCVAQ